MQIDLNGRLAVVTGGASGIGRATATALGAAGCRVLIADRNEAALAAAMRDLNAMGRVIDVANRAAVDAAIAEIESGQGPIDVLVNSAGVLQRMRHPEQLSEKDWDLSLSVNLKGTFSCCAAVGNRMATRGRGSIVNIASVAGMRSGPLYAYGPAKAGIISLTECLAAEWGRSGVRVNAVSPGFTTTPALAAGIKHGALDERRLIESSALGRLVTPAEIANAILFLASDLAAAVTGINLPIDAGYLIAGSWDAYGGLTATRSTL
jgi:NAD(P)-dependent dehydrogenase (short-subunit alcohol dehydrogenase family)